jgi:hypothetical protein
VLVFPLDFSQCRHDLSIDVYDLRAHVKPKQAASHPADFLLKDFSHSAQEYASLISVQAFPVGEEICLLVRAGAVNTRFAISATRLLTVFCSGVPLFWIRF